MRQVKLFIVFAVGIIWGFVSPVLAQSAASNAATPFGINVGVTTCADAEKRIQGDLNVYKNGAVRFDIYGVSGMYKGGKGGVAFCLGLDKPVHTVIIDFNRIEGQPDEIFEVLEWKYTRLTSTMNLENGDWFGDARYAATKGIVTLSAQGVVELSLIYRSKEIEATNGSVEKMKKLEKVQRLAKWL